VDPRAVLDDLEKRKFLTLPELELRPFSRPPVASRYTDYAILLINKQLISSLKSCLQFFIYKNVFVMD
jgi:hypothetical protein